MNIVGSCVPGGSKRRTFSPIVTMTKDASGFRFIVSNRKSPSGRNTRLISDTTRSHASMCSRTSTQTTTSNVSAANGRSSPDPRDSLWRARWRRNGLAPPRLLPSRDRCRLPSPPRRQGFRHETAAAAEIEHPLARPVADDRIEERKARGHHVPQRSQPARIVAPPVRGSAIDRQVVATDCRLQARGSQ